MHTFSYIHSPPQCFFASPEFALFTVYYFSKLYTFLQLVLATIRKMEQKGGGKLRPSVPSSALLDTSAPMFLLYHIGMHMGMDLLHGIDGAFQFGCEHGVSNKPGLAVEWWFARLRADVDIAAIRQQDT